MAPLLVPAAIGVGTVMATKALTKKSKSSAASQPEIEIPEPPPPEPPPATEDITGAGEAERKRLRRRKGRKETFLTGELVPEETGKKRVLG